MSDLCDKNKNKRQSEQNGKLELKKITACESNSYFYIHMRLSIAQQSDININNNLRRNKQTID